MPINGERTKPSAMKVKGKSSVFRLQSHESEGLNLINHLKCRACFIRK